MKEIVLNFQNIQKSTEIELLSQIFNSFQYSFKTITLNQNNDQKAIFVKDFKK